MISRISNFVGPLGSFFSGGTQPNLLLSLDSYNYDLYKKSFTFDSGDSFGVTLGTNSVTSDVGGWHQTRATSVERIPLGKPFKLKFKRGETLGDIMCGVSQDPPINNDATYTRSSYGYYLGYGAGGDTTISITEAGNFSVNVTTGSFPASTIYTIIFDGIKVKYYVNDDLFYTSTTVPSDNLFLYILFLQSGTSITDIEFGSFSPVWNDTSGNGINFNLVNSPKYSNGSLHFNKNLGQYAAGSDLGTLHKFTVDTWFKLNSLPTYNTYPQIVTNAYDTYINFAIGPINGVNEKPWDGKILGGFFANAPNNWITTDGFSPEINVWYNVTLTYDQEYLNLYLNGNLYSSVTCSVPAMSNGSGIYIGRRWDFPNYIDGEIDIVRTWDDAISSSKILDNYNEINPRYITSDASISFGGSSYIDIPGGNAFQLGTSYTIEFWSKALTSSTAGQIFTVMSQRDSNSSIDIFYQSGNLVMRNGVTVTAEPTPGVWTHVAIVSNNTNLSVYYNGISQSVSGNGGNLSDNRYGLSIGKRGPLNNFQYFNGSLYGIRINNTVVYSTGFDPYGVALPPSNIDGTVLLVNEYQNFSGNFIDSSYNKSLVNNGATHSTDVPVRSYRYLRWVMTKTRGADVSSGAIQVADLVLLNQGATVSWNPSASVTNPDGTTYPSETPIKILDYNKGTKWCNTIFGFLGVGTASLYIDNVNPLTFDSYYYVTANDEEVRDPVSWTLAGSNNNSDWAILDTQTNVGITSSRQTNTQIFSIL